MILKMSQATLKAFLLKDLFCPGVKIQPFVYTLALQLCIFCTNVNSHIGTSSGSVLSFQLKLQ